MHGWRASCPSPRARESRLSSARRCRATATKRRPAARWRTKRMIDSALAVDRVLALDDQRWSKLAKLIAEMLREPRPLAAAACRTPAGRQRIGRDSARSGVRQHLDEDLQLLVVARSDPRLRRLRRGENCGLVGAGAQRRAAHARGPAGAVGVAGRTAAPLRAETCRSRAMARRGMAAADRADDEFRKRLTKNEGFPAAMRGHRADAGSAGGTRPRPACASDPGRDSRAAGAGLQRRAVGAGARSGAGVGARRGGAGSSVSRARRGGFSGGVAGGAARAGIGGCADRSGFASRLPAAAHLGG